MVDGRRGHHGVIALLIVTVVNGRVHDFVINRNPCVVEHLVQDHLRKLNHVMFNHAQILLAQMVKS